MPRPAVIYVQTDLFYEVLCGLWLKRRYPGARLIVLSHHSYREIYDVTGSARYLVMHWVQKFCYRKMARYADLVLLLDTVTGDIEEADLKSAGMDLARIERMRNGIDMRDIAEATEGVQPEYDACVVGLRKNKGLEDVVAIWREVCDSRPSTLYVLGNLSRADREWLNAEIARHGLYDRVVFAGHVDPPELYAEIRKARICIAPTHQEPYGIAICEAMACGLPVVAYDLKNYQRLHPGIVKTVPCFDQDGFADAVLELMGDEERMRNMTGRGLEHIRDFDNDKIAEIHWRQITG